MTVGSLFAGIGGFDAGFERAGFSTAWQVEIDAQCREILEQQFPSAERFEDVTRSGIGNLKRVDVICGGFPCQDVSVAGQRAGLAGERTGLFYDAARILQELRPTWFVFENVPGLFSSNKGRDFAEVLRVLMVECGYGVCWRVLNSQFFGVAQRRRRVFIVGRLGRPCPAEVLFEPESCRRDSQASSETGERLAAPLTSGSGVTGNAPGRRREDDFNLVPSLLSGQNRTGGARPPGSTVDNCESLQVVATINSGGNDGGFRTEPGEHIVYAAKRVGTLRADAGAPKHECDERRLICQAPDSDRMRSVAGLPEGLDLLPAGQDSRRYRQLGNAVTVTVAEWIGRRILDYEKACTR